jgi:hypothetical protein
VKTRLVLILIALVAILGAGILVVPTLLSMQQVTFEQDPGLPEGKDISIRTHVDGFGIHKGDAFPYTVEVQYNTELVSELDKTSLDKSINFKPFEVTNLSEREFEIQPWTRALVREYRLQLVDGKVDNLFTFPSILVRYKSKESGAFQEKSITPDPVFISARLPADASEINPKPIQGRLQDTSRNNLPLILGALGVFLALLGLGDLAWRTVPQWREARRQRRRAEGVDVLSEAYRALHAGVAQGAEPKQLLHQMHHMLRILLARKENVAWTDEPNLQQVAPGIRDQVTALYDLVTGADGNEEQAQRQSQAALTRLENVLRFYCGDGEVRAWKR